MIEAMDVLGRGDVCEHCHETDYCSYCLPWSTHHRYDNVKPGCYVCRNAFQTRLDAVRLEATRQKEGYEAKLTFLTLRDPAKADESVKVEGDDVALSVKESEQLIRSHRFILVSPFKTSLISISDVFATPLGLLVKIPTSALE
jgi:hypothetical protein